METEQQHRKKNTKKRDWKYYILNIHFFFFIILIVIIFSLIMLFRNWGTWIDDDYIEEKSANNVDGRDSYDVLFPLLDENGDFIANKTPHTILFFGNGALAEDRDSDKNLVNMIAAKSGSTVYNCAVEESFLASENLFVKYTPSGLDVYNFYWLCLYLTWEDRLDYFDWLESNPDAVLLPETEYVRNTLETIDMNTVDTICIMYDASDYLAGHTFSNEENPTDVLTFTGNLAAGIELLQQSYPHIRIIVMSPTYAFGIDEDGSYVSSDIITYEGGEKLSDYVLKECETSASRNVSFIDHLYGTFNEDEAPAYLRDNLHLNDAGKEKVAGRFVGFLTRYDQ